MSGMQGTDCSDDRRTYCLSSAAGPKPSSQIRRTHHSKALTMFGSILHGFKKALEKDQHHSLIWIQFKASKEQIT
eukprot:1026420-Amphidinium_carterae.1